jgi:hypothetical protein
MDPVSELDQGLWILLQVGLPAEESTISSARSCATVAGHFVGNLVVMERGHVFCLEEGEEEREEEAGVPSDR